MAAAGERRHLVALLLLALMVSAHCLEGGGHHHPRLKRRRKKREIHSLVKTVVVVVMENRSFDHVLGWLRATRPDIDTDKAGYVNSDIREQIFGSADTSAVPPSMSGFAQNARGMGLGMAHNVMSGFAPDSVPVYAALADEFAVFDRC
ncbi:hypothetical protein ZWY2020_002537 [Hordeum vulgare]|nr:hypothetical protein ZWY2020_002537 [Hordeum vulgare]